MRCVRCMKDHIYPPISEFDSIRPDTCQCGGKADLQAFGQPVTTEQLTNFIMLSGGIVETPPEFQAIINKHFWELI